ncbi:MAG TPA: 50S ribosomal protein L25/general stress protein Ctc [Actinomycetaceae bacterium]|nr:50S ribosomal protein L25/general stress protein Ctc [Actinomycetaceae bacterium]
MADDTSTLTATVRTEFGKGAARRTRRANLIPAVLYGHGAPPRHLALPSHATFLALKDNPNVLLTLDIEGEKQTALAKDIQRDPVRRTIDHLDLIIVREGEKVTVDVPIYVVGESAPGTIHQVELQTVSLTVPATSIPEHIEISIEGLEEGTVLRVSDLDRPEDAVIEDDPEYEVVIISVPRISEADLAADEAAAEAGAEAGAEGGAEPAEAPAED